MFTNKRIQFTNKKTSKRDKSMHCVTQNINVRHTLGNYALFETRHVLYSKSYSYSR